MTDEILEKIFLEDRDAVMNFIRHRFKIRTPEEHLEDVFVDSVHILKSKYLENKKVTEYTHARKVLYGIIKIKVSQSLRGMWHEQLNKAYAEGKDMGDGNSFYTREEVVSSRVANVSTLPPSVYAQRKLHRERYAEHKEAHSTWQREYYFKHHEKFLAKEKQPKRLEQRRKYSLNLFRQIKADPIKYAEWRAKKNKWRREQRAAKKAGTWVDRRFYKNRSASTPDMSGNA